MAGIEEESAKIWIRSWESHDHLADTGRTRGRCGTLAGYAGYKIVRPTEGSTNMALCVRVSIDRLRHIGHPTLFGLEFTKKRAKGVCGVDI